MAKFSRRKFLRVSGGTFAGALAGIYFRPYKHHQTEADGMITLNGGDSDVWAWERTVSGSTTDPNCSSVTITVGETSVPTSVTDNGTFSAIVPIAEGENQLTAACADDASLTSEPIIYTGKRRDVPDAFIAVSIDSDVVTLDGSDSQPSEGTRTPIVSYEWSFRADNPAPLTRDIPTLPSFILSAPSIDGEYYVALQVTDANGRTDRSETYFRVENGVAVLPDYSVENPDWIENTVIYGVVVRAFGRFENVTERLDSLVDLGVNCIWLSPVNTSLPGLFGYEVVDYFDLDRRYGDKEDFRNLVQAAHARGIRVLMDCVPSHTSEKHPYFLDTLVNGQASPYWDYYARDENGMYTYYFEYTHLPLLNYDNPEVRRWMMEAMAYWVREFDIDGYRVDVAWGIKERRPEFWMEWRRALKRVKPDLLLIAEAGARDPYYFSNGFDAAYDWTGALGHWAWELVFEDDNLLIFNLDSALTYRRGGGFDPDALIFRFLNNNDTGTRFVTKYGIDRFRVATALLLTLPGIPVVYTGDEYGKAFLPYSETTPISFREQFPGPRDYYKTLIHLRRETPSLHSRFWTIVYDLEPHTKVYAYLRHLEDGSEPLLVLINFFAEPAEVSITLPEAFAAFAASASFQDLITGETVTLTNTAPLGLTMQSYSAMILSPLPSAENAL